MSVQEHFARVATTLNTGRALPLPWSFDQLETQVFGNIPPVKYDTIICDPNLYQMSLKNCYMGQRKLIYGLLNFVIHTLKELNCEPQDLFIVYAGASSLASAQAHITFPGLKILMFDPDRNLHSLVPKNKREDTEFIHKYDRTHVLETPKPLIAVRDWFTDTTAMEVKNVLFRASGRKHLVFISDIRLNNQDENIVQDMLSQATWAIEMRPAASMFKFRIPYMAADGRGCILQQYRTLGDLLPREEPKNDAQMLYLKGQLMLQGFGPQLTAEMRLVSFGPPQLTWYDINRIEDTLATFNCFYRGHALFACRPEPAVFDLAFARHITDEVKPTANRLIHDVETNFEYNCLQAALKSLMKWNSGRKLEYNALPDKIKSMFGHVNDLKDIIYLYDRYLVDDGTNHPSHR